MKTILNRGLNILQKCQIVKEKGGIINHDHSEPTAFIEDLSSLLPSELGPGALLAKLLPLPHPHVLRQQPRHRHLLYHFLRMK